MSIVVSVILILFVSLVFFALINFEPILDAHKRRGVKGAFNMFMAMLIHEIMALFF